MTDGSIIGVARTYYRWWIGALSTLLTPRPKPRAWRILAFHSPQALEIFGRGPIPRLLGRLEHAPQPERDARSRMALRRAVAAHSRHVLLRLSSGDVLERTIQIPKAASDVIEAVLENQLDRLAPWSREETRYGYQVVGPNEQARDQLDVQVVATPRHLLEAALTRVRSLGLAPYAVDFAPEPGARSGIQLLSLEPDPRRKTAARLHLLCMSLLAASLVVGGYGAYQAWERQVHVGTLESRVSQAQSRLAETRSHGEKGARQKQERERLVQRKVEEPAAVVVIEALSRALPDDAFLTELEIHGREARIAGKSPDPTGLITRLESTTQFAGVTFAAPTTREEAGGLRAFSITASTHPGPLEESQR